MPRVLGSVLFAVLLVSASASAAPSEPPPPMHWDITAHNAGMFPRIRSMQDGVTDVYFLDRNQGDMRWDFMHALEYLVPGPQYSYLGNAHNDYLIADRHMYHFVTNTVRPMSGYPSSIHRDVAIWSTGNGFEYENVVTGRNGVLSNFPSNIRINRPSSWETWVAYDYWDPSSNSYAVGLHHIPTDTSLPGPYSYGGETRPHLNLGKLVYERYATGELVWQYLGQPWTEQVVPRPRGCDMLMMPKIGGRWGHVVAFEAYCGAWYLFVASLDTGAVYFVDELSSAEFQFDIQLDRLTYSDARDVIHLVRLDDANM